MRVLGHVDLTEKRLNWNSHKIDNFIIESKNQFLFFVEKFDGESDRRIRGKPAGVNWNGIIE